MKKTFAMLLALSLALTSLAGCGSKPSEAPAGSDPAAEEWPAVNVHYVNINSESMGSKEVQAMVKEFNETNGKNITVEFNYVSGNYQDVSTEVQSYLAAGQDVGVVQVGYSSINYFADNFPQMQDINSVVSTYAPEDADFLSTTYGDAVLNLGKTIDGELAGCAYGMSAPLMFYNADLCKEAGLDVENPPKTWEEARVWAEAIKEKTGNYGLAIQNPIDTWSIIPMFLSSGLDSVVAKNADGSIAAKLYNADTVKSWTTLQQMAKDGLYVHLTLEEGVAAFAGGKVGMFLTTSGRSKYFKSNCAFDVRSAMQPTFEGFDRKVCTGGNVLSIISQDEAQIKASWEFIKFLLQPDNIATWVGATGYLPPTQNALENADLQAAIDSNPLLAAALEERAFASQWTSWPGKNGLQVDQTLVNMRDSILGNLEDVDTAVKTAEETVNGLLAK